MRALAVSTLLVSMGLVTLVGVTEAKTESVLSGRGRGLGEFRGPSPAPLTQVLGLQVVVGTAAAAAPLLAPVGAGKPLCTHAPCLSSHMSVQHRFPLRIAAVEHPE